MTRKVKLLLAGCVVFGGGSLAQQAIQEALPLKVATSLLSRPLISLAEEPDQEVPHSLYGLYYGDWKELGDDEPALVISRDGKPIPPKANEPGAPTLPGLHVKGQCFPFAWSRLTAQGFAFRTVRIEGTSFSFSGKFGREQVEDIGEVPYLEGTLAKKLNSGVVEEKKIHFGHAVIL
ncbi:MAG: hypothetical protein ACHQT6_00025 [Candidatus Acidiferrales bacterium]